LVELEADPLANRQARGMLAGILPDSISPGIRSCDNGARPYSSTRNTFGIGQNFETYGDRSFFRGWNRAVFDGSGGRPIY